MIYAIRTYQKNTGGVGYELFNTSTGEILQRDDCYSVLRAAKYDLEHDQKKVEKRAG